METLDLGEFTGELVSKTYTVFGDQTARTYYVEVFEPNRTFGEVQTIDVLYYESKYDDEGVSRILGSLAEAEAYMMECEGIE